MSRKKRVEKVVIPLPYEELQDFSLLYLEKDSYDSLHGTPFEEDYDKWVASSKLNSERTLQDFHNRQLLAISFALAVIIGIFGNLLINSIFGTPQQSDWNLILISAIIVFLSGGLLFFYLPTEFEYFISVNFIQVFRTVHEKAITDLLRKIAEDYSFPHVNRYYCAWVELAILTLKMMSPLVETPLTILNQYEFSIPDFIDAYGDGFIIYLRHWKPFVLRFRLHSKLKFFMPSTVKRIKSDIDSIHSYVQKMYATVARTRIIQDIGPWRKISSPDTIKVYDNNWLETARQVRTLKDR